MLRMRSVLVTVFAMLLISGCAAHGAGEPEATDAREPERVEVTLTDFTIESQKTSFEAGQPYEFVITNEGALPHELMVMPPLDEHGMEMGHDDPHHGDDALLAVKQEDLPPGETVTVTVTFPESAAGEELEFACHIEGHYEANMRQAIEID